MLAVERTTKLFVRSVEQTGVPFKIYIDEIGDDTDVTEDFDALQEDATFYIIESPGGGVVKGVFSLVGKILNPILKLFTPSTQAAAARVMVVAIEGRHVGGGEVQRPGESAAHHIRDRHTGLDQLALSLSRLRRGEHRVSTGLQRGLTQLVELGG